MNTDPFEFESHRSIPSAPLQRRTGSPAVPRRHLFPRWRLIFAAASWLLLAAAAGQAQTNYAINWFKIAGGGGTSTGSVYTVSGTIGQPDAGTLTNGAYRLVGGFWGVVAAIQTPGAPLLSITRTATNTVAVSWPSPSTGYVLQRNPDLNPANWLDVGDTPSDNGITKTVIVNPPVGNMFYRLRKP